MKKELIDCYIDGILEEMYRNDPELEKHFGERGKEKCREDNYHHFNHLKTAYTLQNDQFFIDYGHWLTRLLVSRGMKAAHVVDNFKRIKQALQQDSSQEASAYERMLTGAISSIERSDMS